MEPSGMEQLLEIEGLGKTYEARGASGGQRALTGVDFTARPGELVSVIGPSGAGKSTLLRCINRLIEPTDGSITFLGDDITHLPKRALRPVRRQIAMIFQNYNLVYRLTAIQNVLHGLLGYKSGLAGCLLLRRPGRHHAGDHSLTDSATRADAASTPTSVRAENSRPSPQHSANDRPTNTAAVTATAARATRNSKNASRTPYISNAPSPS